VNHARAQTRTQTQEKTRQKQAAPQEAAIRVLLLQANDVVLLDL
jgi:hypothetical protein